MCFIQDQSLFKQCIYYAIYKHIVLTITFFSYNHDLRTFFHRDTLLILRK